MLKLQNFSSSDAGRHQESDPTPARTNNSWYHYDPQASIVIVFVHGFLSNSGSCWTSKSGVFWPDLILQDERFGKASVFLGGYHTAHDSADYKIRDCADELLHALGRADAVNRPSPLSSKNILFVCHSLGGIVTRYMLEAYTQKFADKTIGLALMASPSLGSEYADSFSGIIDFYRNGVANQLRHMNNALMDLDSRFKVLIDECRIPRLVGAEAVEHHFLFRTRILPGFKRLVSRESAARYFGASRILPGTDHSTIVKPNTRSCQGHLFLSDFFLNRFIPKIQVPTPAEPDLRIGATPSLACGKGQAFSPNRVLFDIYAPDCANYYFLRSIDFEIKSALSLYSVWVSGPSGCGKTSAIRHYLYESGHKPLEVCLAACQRELDSKRVVEEIAATVYQRYGGETNNFQPNFSGLVTMLAQHSRHSSIILYLDEVPISKESPQGIDELVKLVANLLDSVKHVTGSSDVRFVISSIAAPSDAADNPGKFAEHMLPIAMPIWSPSELRDLLDHLLTHLNFEDFSDDEKLELIDSANGSPRFVKMYLRNRLVSKKMAVAAILDMTLKQAVL